MFQTFDATFGANDFGFPRCFWVAPKFMADGDRDAATASKSDVLSIADAVYRGVPIQRIKSDGWIGSLAAPDVTALVCLDFEGIYARAPIVRGLEMFREAAPNIRVGFYPFFPFLSGWVHDGNRDAVIASGKALKQKLSSAKNYFRPIVKLVDYLSPDFYLLGDACFERDLEYIKAVSSLLNSFDKPIYPFIWGRFHPAFPQKIPMPSRQQLQRYGQTLREECDGCIVWGPLEENRELMQVINEQSDSRLARLEVRR